MARLKHDTENNFEVQSRLLRMAIEEAAEDTSALNQLSQDLIDVLIESGKSGVNAGFTHLEKLLCLYLGDTREDLLDGIVVDSVDLSEISVGTNHIQT